MPELHLLKVEFEMNLVSNINTISQLAFFYSSFNILIIRNFVVELYNFFYTWFHILPLFPFLINSVIIIVNP